MWSLVSNASVVVQLVMLTLVAASVTSWIMIFQRSTMLRAGRRALDAFEERFWSGIDLSKLYRQAGSNPDPDSGVEQICRFQGVLRLRQQPGVDPDAVMEGVGRAMRVAISREEEKLEQSLPFLATVGSTSPYIGLFGTVWGIMNSFRGLASAQQATLATVAPGIAEALIATAIGLFAAIPAVIAYNRFSARSETLMAVTTPSPTSSRRSCTAKCTPAKNQVKPMALIARVRHKRKPVAEMNVVPYIDVMLVLLVIFMVTAPMLNQGVKVDLPKVSSEALPQDNNVQILTISIKADKTYYWNLGSEVDTDKQMDKAMTLPEMTDAVTKIIRAGNDQQADPGLHSWRQVRRLRRGHGCHGRVAEGRCR
jgi:biopolymer transport protein TolQ